MKIEQLLIRDANPNDLNLIFSNWTKSQRHNGVNHYMPYMVYQERFRKILTTLLYLGAQLKVLCDTKDTNYIFGWACVEYIDNQPILHWVHVKSLYRGNGLATHLLKELGFSKSEIICSTCNSWIVPILEIRKGYNFVLWPKLIDRVFVDET